MLISLRYESRRPENAAASASTSELGISCRLRSRPPPIVGHREAVRVSDRPGRSRTWCRREGREGGRAARASSAKAVAPARGNAGAYRLRPVAPATPHSAGCQAMSASRFGISPTARRSSSSRRVMHQMERSRDQQHELGCRRLIAFPCRAPSGRNLSVRKPSVSRRSTSRCFLRTACGGAGGGQSPEWVGARCDLGQSWTRAVRPGRAQA